MSNQPFTQPATDTQVEIQYTPVAGKARKASWSVSGEARFLIEVEHTCGHWEATVATPAMLSWQRLYNNLTKEDCLKCVNKAAAKARRAARKAAN